MSKFTNKRKKELLQNKYILTFSKDHIIYTEKFRKKVIMDLSKGKRILDIFESCGLNPNEIGLSSIKANKHNWSKEFKIIDENGRRKVVRIKGAYPILNDEGKIQYMTIEGGKLVDDYTEEQINELSHEIIKELVQKYDEKAQVKHLCEIAKVSRSGYYNYFSEKSIENRNKKENQDEKDRDIILDAFNRHGYKKGAKGIKMTLENEDKIIFNLKHIRRIMKKYNIICPIRKAGPYKQMLKKDLEHRTVENKLKRDFKQEKPGKVLLTDITYLSYGYYKRAYLSTIKDASTNEIMAYSLSTNLYLDFVLNTMWDLTKQKEVPIPEDAFVHSDQGSHYTSPTFQSLLKELKLGQSMSRKGNCWDNAPQESFFGHMKDEVDFKACSTFEELQVEFDKYIEYYNNYRYQWNLKKMSPVQYRNHLLQNQ